MTGPTASAGRQELGKEQFAKLRQAASAAGVQLARTPAGDDIAPDLVWQANHILVTGQVDATNSALQRFGAQEVYPAAVRPGLARLMRINADARDAVAQLNGSADFPGTAYLNYVLSICPVNLCPGDEPKSIPAFPATAPIPDWDDGGSAGENVYVKVIDTGLATGWDDPVRHPWLVQPTPVTGQARSAFDPSGAIALYAGHGEFIAGVLRCVAPRVRVDVSNALQWAGGATEFTIRDALLAALEEYPRPNIISLSAGCATLDGTAPRALREVIDRMRQPDCKTLLVAAAGNDGLGPGSGAPGQFYPAAFASDEDFVVAVGALRQNASGRACFSNYGRWVSVFDIGERLINAFPAGRYVYSEPKTQVCLYHQGLEPGCTCVTSFGPGDHDDFDGMSVWSGTSFAAPMIAGRIAAHMSKTNESNARLAWADLRSSLRTVADVGDGVPLKVLPAMGS